MRRQCALPACRARQRPGMHRRPGISLSSRSNCGAEGRDPEGSTQVLPDTGGKVRVRPDSERGRVRCHLRPVPAEDGTDRDTGHPQQPGDLRDVSLIERIGEGDPVDVHSFAFRIDFGTECQKRCMVSRFQFPRKTGAVNKQDILSREDCGDIFSHNRRDAGRDHRDPAPFAGKVADHLL